MLHQLSSVCNKHMILNVAQCAGRNAKIERIFLCLDCHNGQLFALNLLELFQCPHASAMQVCCISGTQQASRYSGLAALSVVVWATVAIRSGSEDGSAGYNSGRGRYGDQLRARWSRNIKLTIKTLCLGFN